MSALRPRWNVSTGLSLGLALMYLCALVWGLLHFDYYALTWIGLSFYIVAPALLGSLSLAALITPPTVRSCITLGLMSFTVLLVACNALLALASFSESEPVPASPGADQRGRAEVIRALRDSGVDAYPALPVGLFLANTVREHRFLENELPAPFQTEAGPLIPLQGLANTCTLLCNETGQYVTYVSDEFGFNNPRGLHAIDRVDLALVGDSYVAGYCMPRRDTLVGRLRNRFPRTIGVGSIGNGPLLELALLREYTARLRPKHVLWVFYENDLEDLEVERRFPLLRRYLEPGFSQQLVERRESVARSVRSVMDAHLARLDGAGQTGEGPGGMTAATGPWGILTLSRLRLRVDGLHNRFLADYALFDRILGAANDEVGAWGGKLHLVYLPSWSYGRGRMRTLDLSRNRNRRHVLAIARGHGIRVIDLVPPFLAHERLRSLFLAPGKHYSAAGYDLAAREIAAALATEASLHPADANAPIPDETERPGGCDPHT